MADEAAGDGIALEGVGAEVEEDSADLAEGPLAEAAQEGVGD